MIDLEGVSSGVAGRKELSFKVKRHFGLVVLMSSRRRFSLDIRF